MQIKIQQNLTREQQIREVQRKAANERELNRQKLRISKALISESRRSMAVQRKNDSRSLVEISTTCRAFNEQEKRQKAEEERMR